MTENEQKIVKNPSEMPENGIDEHDYPYSLYEKCARCGNGWPGLMSWVRCRNCDNTPYWASETEIDRPI